MEVKTKGKYSAEESAMDSIASLSIHVLAAHIGNYVVYDSDLYAIQRDLISSELCREHRTQALLSPVESPS